MNCQEARKLVHLFIDGELDCRANVDVLAHLNMCGACSGRFEEARRFEEFLKERMRPPAAPEAVRLRVERALEEVAAPWPRRWLGGLRRHPLAVASAAAVLLVAAGTGWRIEEIYTTCPFVRGTVDSYNEMQTGAIEMPVDATRTEALSRKWGRQVHLAQLPGMRFAGANVVAIDSVNRDAVAEGYTLPHCPEGHKCVVLFLVNAPGSRVGDHDCVERGGRRFSQWEYNGCRVVCWKDETTGEYCLLCCKKHEMEKEGLLDLAAVAATE